MINAMLEVHVVFLDSAESFRETPVAMQVSWALHPQRGGGLHRTGLLETTPAG